MKRHKSLSKALSLAPVVWLAVWSCHSAQAQETRLNAKPVISDREAKPVVQLGHSGGISSLDISSNNRYLLTGSLDSTARLWEMITGRVVRVFWHSDNINSATFSPDDRYVLTGSRDHTAKLWETETGREVRTFTGHSGGVTSVAFSSDGKYVLTGSEDKTARLWEAETGRSVRRFVGHSGEVTSIAISANGKYVLTGSQDSTARLWETETGRQTQQFVEFSSEIMSVAISPDSKYVLTGSQNWMARLWEAETGRLTRSFEGHSSWVSSVAFSSNGKLVLTGSWDHTARLWETESGREVRRFGKEFDKSKLDDDLDEDDSDYSAEIRSVAFALNEKYVLIGYIFGMTELWNVETARVAHIFVGFSDSVSSAVFSADGRYVLTNSDAGLWEIESGRELRNFPQKSSLHKTVISADSKYLLAEGWGNSVLLLEVETGREVRKFEEHTGSIARLTLSSDSKYAVVVSDKSAWLWETETGRKLREFIGHSDDVTSVAFSPDGNYVLTGSDDKTARLWETETGREVRKFEGHIYGVNSVAFSPDGKYVLTGSDDITARLWEIETGREVRKFTGHSHFVLAVAFSPDGRHVLTGSVDHTVRLWETETGREVRQFIGHSGTVWSVAFSPDGKYALTAGLDSTTRLWTISNGIELCSLVSFRDGSWIVVAPDGRFDTSSFDDMYGLHGRLHWVMADEPMKTYPLEIFSRDYYEPRLLPRLLNGEQFKPIQSIATLNRVQPEVSIASIAPHKESPDLVNVTIKVSKASGRYKQGDKIIFRETGVYDLRLFRDGHLVAQLPQFNPSANSTTMQAGTPPEQMRKAWREQSRIKLEANGEQIITFENIRLPRMEGTKRVEFSAYAFNEDRVKSQTHKKAFDVPKNLAPVKGRAYLLTIGVNAYENRAWNLRFAANDARLAQQVLHAGLKQWGEFVEVINVSLISDVKPAADTKPATKANFKAALEEIARQARPEDLVMIYYASHGYADRNGNYFFFTADTGSGRSKKITPELLSHSISSDELSAWLKDLDAGEMALIVDACQSAGTVKGEDGGEFKPGPMGSRGLGQLAYDKGMRILAASQADDFAFETAALQHGLLTYALMKDGVQDRKADLNFDRQITLSEALAYSLKRVPKLYEATRSGKLAEMFKAEGNRGPQVVGEGSSLRKKYSFQRPSLFDFAKKRREIVLAGSTGMKARGLVQ